MSASLITLQHQDGSDAGDATLARRAAEGDRQAYEIIYRRHVNRIHGLCLRLTGDPVEAETLAQDAFVRGWFGIEGYRGTGDLGGWLARIAVNLWRDKLRQGNRIRRMQEELAREGADLAAAQSGSRTGRHDGIIPLLTGVDLERCIPRLPAGGRAVFVLHDVEGYTHREIAGMLGVATGTVKAQLHRVRGLLRGMLADSRKESDERE